LTPAADQPGAGRGLLCGRKAPGRGAAEQEWLRKGRLRGTVPPPGRPHRYFFRLYALDLRPTLAREGLLKAIEGHVLARAELWASYGRGLARP